MINPAILKYKFKMRALNVKLQNKESAFCKLLFHWKFEGNFPHQETYFLEHIPDRISDVLFEERMYSIPLGIQMKNNSSERANS